MMLCVYCLISDMKAAAGNGEESITVEVSARDSRTAATIVDGDAVCVGHLSERIGNVGRALAAVAKSASGGVLTAEDRAALSYSVATPGWRTVHALTEGPNVVQALKSA
jgi:hypothetical protein